MIPTPVEEKDYSINLDLVLYSLEASFFKVV